MLRIGSAPAREERASRRLHSSKLNRSAFAGAALGRRAAPIDSPPFFHHGPHVLVAPADLDSRALGVGIEDVDLVEADSRVGQQRRRVRGDQHLPAGLRMHPGHEARQVPHQGVVQGELGFFQQQRATPFRQGPEQPDQAQRAVRERAFVLSRRALPPVAETRFQMPAAACILLKRQAVELRNGDLQGLVDVAQPRIASLGRRRGDFLEEIAAERIVVLADGPFWITHQVGARCGDTGWISGTRRARESPGSRRSARGTSAPTVRGRSCPQHRAA